MRYVIRKAEKTDISFLVDCVINSEKINTDIISYCSLFEITEEDLRTQVTLAFTEEMSVFVWDVNQWLVMLNDNEEIVAGLAYWIEPPEVNSETQKFQFLSYLNKSKVRDAQFMARFEAIKKLQIPRNSGLVQLDFLYTQPEYRGQGLMSQLIKFVFNQFAIHNFQIQVLGSNLSAIKLYKKLAFETNIVVTLKGLHEAKLMPDDTKLNMIKHGTNRNL